MGVNEKLLTQHSLGPITKYKQSSENSAWGLGGLGGLGAGVIEKFGFHDH